MGKAALNDVIADDTHWPEVIATLATTYDVFKYLRSTAEEFGFKKFSVVEVPWEETTFANAMIMNNWDPEFVQAYDELNLARNSPIFLNARRSVLSMQFNVRDVQQENPTEQRAAAMEEFDSFRDTQGITMPVFAPNGLRGAITFSGASLKLDFDEAQKLHMRAIHIFARLVDLRAREGSGRIDLTQKERECLTWTALGKTSGEIADILDLSINSVNHHLTACCKKLNATNRVSAVAIAVRSGLVE